MAKKLILSPKEMQVRRASAWEFHYKRRGWAMLFAPQDAARIAGMISANVPAPEMRLDGYVVDGIETLRGQCRVLERLNVEGIDRMSLCAWYWSESEWLQFIHLYQSLPEVYEPHYWYYDAALDAARVLPLSCGGSAGEVRGKSGGSVRVPLSKGLHWDNP
jgi:hypothetical protein